MHNITQDKEWWLCDVKNWISVAAFTETSVSVLDISKCACNRQWNGVFLVKYLKYLKLRCNVNPQRGPFHYRAPSRIFYHTVRGMIPHKTKRGMAALNRLKVCVSVSVLIIDHWCCPCFTGIWRNPSTLQQAEEDGGTGCSPSTEAKAWTQGMWSVCIN